MAEATLFCRTATPFKKAGGLDEEGLRGLLQRFVDNRIGVVLGSSGTGEGYAMTAAELRRLFDIGKEVCAGKVPVIGNPPEQHTAKATREMSMLAVEAKTDAVTIFGLAGWHGMKPTDYELRNYYDAVLGAIKHPVCMAVNNQVGYTPKVSIVADMCNRYPQIESVVLNGATDTYLIELKGLVSRELKYYSALNGSLNMLSLGVHGIFAAEANALPKTYRRYVDLYNQGKFAELAAPYTEIKRFLQYVAPWSHANARWVKMYMNAFKLPGGEGGMREPYYLPPADEMAKFTAGLLRLGIPEVDEQARLVGMKAAA